MTGVQTCALPIYKGFTGIGVEGTHLHLDLAHSVKTLWGDDFHFGSAPQWAKSMTDWGNASGVMTTTNTQGAGAGINSMSIKSEALASTTSCATCPAKTAMTAQQQNQNNARITVAASNAAKNNPRGEVSIALRLESLVA